MDLREYADVLWRRKTVILVAAGVALIATLIGVLFQSRKYEATATVRVSAASLVTDGAVRTDDVAYTDRLIATYTRILLGPGRDELKRRFGAATASVHVSTPANTELMRITVVAKGRQAAAIEANALAQFLLHYVKTQALQSGEGAIDALRQNIVETRAKLLKAQANYNAATAAPVGPDRVTEARNQLDLAEASFSLAQSSYQSAIVARSTRATSASLAEPATPPTSAAFPRTSRAIVFALVGGLLLGLALAFIAENLDDTLHSEKSIEDVARIPILGRIPFIRRKSPFALAAGNSPWAEAFRRLRTGLLTGKRKEIRSLAVTSAGRGEGKSTVAANLAYVVAQAGRRVVLIDADLRRPTQHRLFDRPNAVGLSSVLAGQFVLSDALQETPFPNLHLLPAGPPPDNPAESVGSSEMTKVLRALSNEFDVMLLDTPSFLDVADAASLATKVDGLLLVVARGCVNRVDVASVLAQLEDIQANAVGVVVTRSARKTQTYAGEPDAESPAGRLQVVNE